MKTLLCNPKSKPSGTKLNRLMSTFKISFIHSNHHSNLCHLLSARTSVMTKNHMRCRSQASREDLGMTIRLKIEGSGQMIRMKVKNQFSPHSSSMHSSNRRNLAHLSVRSISHQLAHRKTNRKFRWTINHSQPSETSNNRLDVNKMMQMSGQSQSNNLHAANKTTQMSGRNPSNNQCNFFKSSYKEVLFLKCSLKV